RRQEGVDARADGALYGFPRLVDVVLVGARQAGDGGRRLDLAILAAPRLAAHGVGDALHRLEIAGAGSREAGLHDVDAQARQLVCDLHLFLDIEGRAGALLAIAQGGVKDDDGVAVGDRPRVLADVGDGKLFDIYGRYAFNCVFAVMLRVAVAILYIGAHGWNLLRLVPEWNL